MKKSNQFFAICFESELKDGFYEKIDNNNFLCEYETEQEIDEQLKIYEKNDVAENVHYLYNVFLVNEFYPGNDQTAADDAKCYAVFEKLEDNTLKLIYAPYLFNDTDQAKEEIIQFKKAIRLHFEHQNKNYLYCQLWKQFQS